MSPLFLLLPPFLMQELLSLFKLFTYLCEYMCLWDVCSLGGRVCPSRRGCQMSSSPLRQCLSLNLELDWQPEGPSDLPVPPPRALELWARTLPHGSWNLNSNSGPCSYTARSGTHGAISPLAAVCPLKDFLLVCFIQPRLVLLLISLCLSLEGWGSKPAPPH